MKTFSLEELKSYAKKCVLCDSKCEYRQLSTFNNIDFWYINEKYLNKYFELNKQFTGKIKCLNCINSNFMFEVKNESRNVFQLNYQYLYFDNLDIFIDYRYSQQIRILDLNVKKNFYIQNIFDGYATKPDIFRLKKLINLYKTFQ